MIKENKLFLSFSAIETFNTCQRKYFYNYIAKLPKKYWPWLTFGTFNHLVLEKFHKYIIYFKKRNIEYDKKALMKKAFDSALKKHKKLVSSGKQIELTEKQVIDSKKILKKYYNRISLVEPNVFCTEKYFEIDLGDGIWIRGFIDRVDRIAENKFKIIDYKTSKKEYSVSKNDQLNIYAIGFKRSINKEDIEIFKQLDFIKIDKRSPENEEGERHNNLEDEKILKKIKDSCIEIRTKIQNDKIENRWEPKENDFCWCCDFKKTCDKQRQISEDGFLND